MPQWSIPKSAAARAHGSGPKPPEIFDLPADWKPGQKAVKRQQLFQLCDIKLNEVQSILEANVARASCNDKDGWLQKDVYPKMRKEMQRQIRIMSGRKEGGGGRKKRVRRNSKSSSDGGAAVGSAGSGAGAGEATEEDAMASGESPAPEEVEVVDLPELQANEEEFENEEDFDWGAIFG